MLVLGGKLAPPKSDRSWLQVLAELEARHRAQTGPRWHLVQVAPGERDKHAVEWLARRGYEPYYPVIRSLRRPAANRLSRKQRAEGRALREVLEPIFHRYVLTRFDPRAGGWREIFRASGVTGIACEGNMPVPISDDLVARLRANEVDGAIPGETPASELFHLGQLVEVTEGPFRFFRGTVERINSSTIDGLDSQTRITVAIDIFGRLTPAEFDASQIDPVNLAAL
jgi:transcription antitermination factor NusG